MSGADSGVAIKSVTTVTSTLHVDYKLDLRNRPMTKEDHIRRRERDSIPEGRYGGAFSVFVRKKPQKNLSLAEAKRKWDKGISAQERAACKASHEADPCRRFFSLSKLKPRWAKRLTELTPFFTEDRLRNIVVPLTTASSGISLRVLDWFVINFSKRKQISIVSPEKLLVDVYMSYREWLRQWRRGLYDAFRRSERLYFELDGHRYSTTVAQLNFIFWAVTKGVLQYANENCAVIEADMNKRYAECKRQKEARQKAGKKRKRAELSKTSAPQACMMMSLPITIRF